MDGETRRRVLVVDDELLFRVLMKQLLRSTAYEVVAEAGDGQQAVVQFEAKRPDMVLMDVMMPDMDGVMAVRRILAIEPQACIVMCSAVGAQRVLLEALQAGARDYVMKPFSRQKVLEALDKAWGAG
jgi:two-component system chemotaxis response regulator CheY